MNRREARELQRLPPAFAATRQALHRVAEEIVAPARKPQNEIALRATPGGFGTPEFEFEGENWQVRVEGPSLVVAQGADERRTRLTTLRAAAELIGGQLFPDGMPSDDGPLDIDDAAAVALGDWCAFGGALLSNLREGLQDSMEPSEINLWPEHFDIAFEAGSEMEGKRANFGASPGDENHAEPYIYVGPWSATVDGDLWQAKGFSGAELGYGELIAADDPQALAWEFVSERLAALESIGATV